MMGLFLQKLSFVFKHKVGQLNKMADALNRRSTMLAVLKIEVTCFEYLKEDHPSDSDFSAILAKCEKHEVAFGFHIHIGYLFKGHQLCVPVHSSCESLIIELHFGFHIHVGYLFKGHQLCVPMHPCANLS